MSSVDLSTLYPLLERLETRAVQWQGRGIQEDSGRRARDELRALKHCTCVPCVRTHMASLLSLTETLPEADITLIRALREAIDTWL